MSDLPLNIEEIDHRIAVLKETIHDLVEQAAGTVGAADEELISERIAEQENKLELLVRQRSNLRPARS